VSPETWDFTKINGINHLRDERWTNLVSSVR
jgi:hypothetical protein